jgi:hypothetical protein
MLNHLRIKMFKEPSDMPEFYEEPGWEEKPIDEEA